MPSMMVAIGIALVSVPFLMSRLFKTKSSNLTLSSDLGDWMQSPYFITIGSFVFYVNCIVHFGSQIHLIAFLAILVKMLQQIGRAHV